LQVNDRTDTKSGLISGKALGDRELAHEPRTTALTETDPLHEIPAAISPKRWKEFLDVAQTSTLFAQQGGQIDIRALQGRRTKIRHNESLDANLSIVYSLPNEMILRMTMATGEVSTVLAGADNTEADIAPNAWCVLEYSADDTVCHIQAFDSSLFRRFSTKPADPIPLSFRSIAFVADTQQLFGNVTGVTELFSGDETDNWKIINKVVIDTSVNTLTAGSLVPVVGSVDGPVRPNAFATDNLEADLTGLTTDGMWAEFILARAGQPGAVATIAGSIHTNTDTDKEKAIAFHHRDGQWNQIAGGEDAKTFSADLLDLATGDYGFTFDAADSDTTPTATDKPIDAWGIRPVQSNFTASSQKHTWKITKEGIIEIAIPKHTVTPVTVMLQETANVANQFSVDLALDGSLSQPVGDPTNELSQVTATKFDNDEYWMVRLAGIRPMNVNLRIWANDIGDPADFEDIQYAFRVVDPLSLDYATQSFVRRENINVPGGTWVDLGGGLEIRAGGDNNVVNYPRLRGNDGNAKLIFTQSWYQTSEAAEPTAFVNIFERLSVGEEWGLRENTGYNLQANYVQHCVIYETKTGREWLVRYVVQPDDVSIVLDYTYKAGDIYSVPNATVSKTEINVTLSGATTNFVGGGTVRTLLEGSGEKTFGIDLPTTDTIDEIATLAGFPAGVTGDVDPFNKRISIEVAEGTGDVTIPIVSATLAASDGSVVHTFTQDGATLGPAVPIQGWQFSVNGTQALMTNKSSKRRWVFSTGVRRQDSRTDNMVDADNSIRSRGLDPDESIWLTLTNITNDYGGGELEGDIEYYAVDVYEIEDSPRNTFTRIHTLHVSKATGSAHDNNDWRVVVLPNLYQAPTINQQPTVGVTLNGAPFAVPMVMQTDSTAIIKLPVAVNNEIDSLAHTGAARIARVANTYDLAEVESATADIDITLTEKLILNPRGNAAEGWRIDEFGNLECWGTDANGIITLPNGLAYADTNYQVFPTVAVGSNGDHTNNSLFNAKSYIISPTQFRLKAQFQSGASTANTGWPMHWRTIGRIL